MFPVELTVEVDKRLLVDELMRIARIAVVVTIIVVVPVCDPRRIPISRALWEIRVQQQPFVLCGCVEGDRFPEPIEAPRKAPIAVHFVVV